MKHLVLAFAAMVSATPAVAVQPGQTPAGGGMVCVSLSGQYEARSKEISAINAEGAGDDSAPRELVRQQRIGNEIAKAGVLISLLAANKCTLPTEAPSDSYTSAALTCRLALLKGEAGDACVQATWRKDIGAISLSK